MTRSDFTFLGEEERRITKMEDLNADTVRYLSCR